MSKLVIVESPAKAKNIKKYLGKGYEVTASMGHVRDLPPARLSVDVENDFEAKYGIIKGKQKIVKDLKALAKKSDEVILATDPDREGEAISWHLAHILKLDEKAVNRVEFNEITKKGVLEGMAKPRQIDRDLVDAQQARRILDRLVGYKLSPFVSQKIRRGLSAGRVQSVAVRLIVDREEEIRAFVPEEYWTLDAIFAKKGDKKEFEALFWGDETGKVEVKTKEQSDSYLKRLKGADYKVTEIRRGKRKRSPAPPYITSTLQQDASNRLGFQARRTMSAAQQLYEGVDVKGVDTTGLITYMRTDSVRISDGARQDGNAYIVKTYGKDYLPAKPRYFRSKKGAQDGHEAIRPTDPTLSPAKVKSSLTSDQFKIYDLIWTRFMASLMAESIHNTVRAKITANDCIFTASGYTVAFDGYAVLYKNTQSAENGELPPLKEGDSVDLKKLGGNQHFTQPPARYSEATLIKALEDDGIGRPSTYASIISTIVGREYVVRESRRLFPTELGEAVNKLLSERFPDIVDVTFTANMEADLDKVGEGKQDYVKLLHKFYGPFDETLEKVKEEMQGVKIQLKEDQTDIPCELCGKNMVIKTGRYGKFLACPGFPDCKNAKPLVIETDGICPRDGGAIIEKKTKRGYVFYGCSNYPECNFMTWSKPTKEKCPETEDTLFETRGGRLECLNEKCGYTFNPKTEKVGRRTFEKKDDKKKKPAKKAVATKTTAKKTPAKKAVASKTVAKKAPAKKAVATKTTAKKAPAKKAVATKTVAKKAPKKKAVASKTTAKKAPAKKAVASKTVAKKSPAKKATATKTTAKKTTKTK